MGWIENFESSGFRAVGQGIAEIKISWSASRVPQYHRPGGLLGLTSRRSGTQAELLFMLTFYGNDLALMINGLRRFYLEVG